MGFQGFLKQSTAVDVKIGPFVDSTDGDAEETGLTIAQGDVILSKNGQTGAQKNDATAAAHAEDGMYNCEFDATDTDTVGQLTLGVHVAGALFVRHDWHVVEEEVYDDLFAASGVGYLKPVTGGRDIDITTGGAAGIDWGNIENKTTVNDLTQTDIQLVDTATAVTNQVTADMTAISGDSTAADNLEALMDGVLVVTVNDASATTTAFATDGFTEATDDHFNGRLITFITGDLAFQQTDITDYDAADGTQGSQEFTVTATSANSAE